MSLNLRKARPEDKPKVLEVEAKSTPNLQYLPYMYEEWMSDPLGELSVVEYEGEIIGVGKYSRLPDASAWLEALRVTPPRQGIGGGKILYNLWAQLAEEQNVSYMAMYTGTTNVQSKGLAEKYGLNIRGFYKEGQYPLKDAAPVKEASGFRRVKDLERAASLVAGLGEKWRGFMVLNRTWYRINAANSGFLAHGGMVYEDPESGSVVALGSRMMPWQALHIPVMKGDYDACLRFALKTAQERKVERLNIIFPPDATDIQEAITRFGFKNTGGDLITMGINLK